MKKHSIIGLMMMGALVLASCGMKNDLYKCELTTDSDFSLSSSKEAKYSFTCNSLKHDMEVTDFKVAVTASKRIKMTGGKSRTSNRNLGSFPILKGKTIKIKKGENYKYDGSLKVTKPRGYRLKMIVTGRISYPKGPKDEGKYLEKWKHNLTMSRSI